MTPAERLVVAAAVRWHQHVATDGPYADGALVHAVDVLLAERAGPQPETVEVTWAQVVTGDEIYRGADGRALEVGAPGGDWHEVLRTGGIIGTDRVRIFARGIAKPIQPIASRFVVVRRSTMGRAVDVLGSVLWSGATVRES